MERKVVDCDRCGAPDSVEQGRFKVPVHRGLDAAGSNSTDFQDIDLCPGCMAAELKAIIKEMSFEQGKAFVDRVLSSTAHPNRKTGKGLTGWRSLQ